MLKCNVSLVAHVCQHAAAQDDIILPIFESCVSTSFTVHPLHVLSLKQIMILNGYLDTIGHADMSCPPRIWMLKSPVAFCFGLLLKMSPIFSL